MRYHALAADYDGTLAVQGRIEEATLVSLRRLRASGRRLLMVTGRRIAELLQVCPEVGLFDRVVAENGAVLFDPATGREDALGDAPPEALLRALRARAVDPLDVGRVIVATLTPQAPAARDAMSALGMDRRLIFNKDALMILPAGIDKASGLEVALAELQISAHNVVGVGDAENDAVLLAACECGVAVANALPSLKARADIVTVGARGAGVAELCDALVDSDLCDLAPRLVRHDVPIGTDPFDRPVLLPAGGAALLISCGVADGSVRRPADGAGGGVRSLARALVDGLVARRYQTCVIDAGAGDGAGGADSVAGAATRPAEGPSEVIARLEGAQSRVVVQLGTVPDAERGRFVQDLFARLCAMRAAVGRPHWIVLDEIHRLLPQVESLAAVRGRPGLLLATQHPAAVSTAVFSLADIVVAVGASPAETAQSLRAVLPPPDGAFDAFSVLPGDAIAWRHPGSEPPFALRRSGGRQARTG